MGQENAACLWCRQHFATHGAARWFCRRNHKIAEYQGVENEHLLTRCPIAEIVPIRECGNEIRGAHKLRNLRVLPGGTVQRRRFCTLLATAAVGTCKQPLLGLPGKQPTAVGFNRFAESYVGFAHGLRRRERSTGSRKSRLCLAGTILFMAQCSMDAERICQQLYKALAIAADESGSANSRIQPLLSPPRVRWVRCKALNDHVRC